MPSISIPSLVTAGIGAAGAIGGAAIASHGATSAANTQANAADTAAQTQLQMYNQTRSDLSGYNSTGMGAINQLASLFGLPGTTGRAATGPTAATAAGATAALAQYPGYQFGLDQGTQALDRSAASKGLLLSGAQLTDTQEFGQNYAMQNAWQPYVSELNQFSSLGENAAAQTGNAGTAAAAGAAQSQLAAGTATASGQVANSNILNNLTQNQALQSSLASFFTNNSGGSGGVYSAGDLGSGVTQI